MYQRKKCPTQNKRSSSNRLMSTYYVLGPEGTQGPTPQPLLT